MVALKEQTDRDLELDVDEALWDFDTYMYAGNLLAAPSGATVGRKPSQVSKGQSALSGALSGAAIGAELGTWGGPIGAVAGGFLGWALN